MLRSALVSRVGTSHRANFVALHCICRTVLPTKDVPTIFSEICLMGYHVPGYWNDIKYLERHTFPVSGDFIWTRTWKKKLPLTRVTLSDAMPTRDCCKIFLECCYNRPVNLWLWSLKEAPWKNKYSKPSYFSCLFTYLFSSCFIPVFIVKCGVSGKNTIYQTLNVLRRGTYFLQTQILLNFGTKMN